MKGAGFSVNYTKPVWNIVKRNSIMALYVPIDWQFWFESLRSKPNTNSGSV